MESKPEPLFPSLDPVTLLNLARQLATQADPASQRTAGDRAYYAAFLFSRDNLAAKDHFTPSNRSEDHILVQNVLRRPNVLGAFGDYENQLRRARNAATYDIQDLHMGKDVRSLEWMIEKASEIIDRVNRVPNRT